MSETVDTITVYNNDRLVDELLTGDVIFSELLNHFVTGVDIQIVAGRIQVLLTYEVLVA